MADLDLDLVCVSSFLVLLQENHYGRASAHLSITSPALTKRVQRLERQLRCRLVERGPSGTLVVTDAGARFACAAQTLLAEVSAARAAVESRPVVLRLGIPSGSPSRSPLMNFNALARELRRSHPCCTVVRVELPFPRLRTAVADGEVDVLVTGPPVWHRATTCHPLPASAVRVGLVSTRHPLADAGTIDVEEFADLPMLYDPSLPREWMEVFVLDDVRPAREARLVDRRVTDTRAVFGAVAEGSAVVATLAAVMPPEDRSRRTLQLRGATPVEFHVATRTADRRTTVQALVEALRTVVGAGATDDVWVRRPVPVGNRLLPR